MKRISVLILVLLMVFTLAACDEDNDSVVGGISNPTSSTTAPENTSDEAIQKLADEAQIQHDLTTQQGHIFYLNNQDTPLIFKSIEIQRRKTNGNDDEIHIAATLNNAYYTVNADYILYYSYYNVGGWCIDHYEITNYESKATANPVTDQDMVAYLQNHFSSAQITDRVQSTTITGAYCETVYFSATIDYPYLTANFSGWYNFEFNNHCWYETYDFDLTSYDWSAFIGRFRYIYDLPSYGGNVVDYQTIEVIISDIEQVDKHTVRLKYSSIVNNHYKDGSTSAEGYKVEAEKEITAFTGALTTVWNKNFQIPTYASTLYLPCSIEVSLHRDDGVKSHNMGLDYTVCFDKVIS